MSFQMDFYMAPANNHNPEKQIRRDRIPQGDLWFVSHAEVNIMTPSCNFGVWYEERETPGFRYIPLNDLLSCTALPLIARLRADSSPPMFLSDVRFQPSIGDC